MCIRDRSTEYPCRLTHTEHEGLKKMSRDFGAALDRRNISWVMCEGTLIGAMREGCIMQDDTDVDFCIIEKKSPLWDADFRAELVAMGYVPHPDESSLDPGEPQYQYVYASDQHWLAGSGVSSWASRMSHSLFKPLNIDLYDHVIWTDPIEFSDGHVVVLKEAQMKPAPHRMAVGEDLYPFPSDLYGVQDSKFPGWRVQRIHFAVLCCMLAKWLPLVLALAYVAACWNVTSWSPQTAGGG
eukprot:TRINITY_DN4337_c0_g1_i2.p1 TRINITY_DN4337_c0_g1~~TRINITY_DN4337_c0_g1_i2.p1  ORF type:complete len:240 (-),score=48.53 TRINITY_DN4337_c0_g1_i2:177-896(-)